MKKNLFITLASVAFCITSCTKPDPSESSSIKEVSASLESINYDSGPIDITWKENDKISIHNTTGAQIGLTLTNGAGSNSGTFTVDGDQEIKPKLNGYYPASILTSSSLVWPDVQTGITGLTDLPMTAVTEKDGDKVKLNFKHLGGALEIELSSLMPEDIAVKEVTVSSTTNGISGRFKVKDGVATEFLTPTSITTGDISSRNISISSEPTNLFFAVPAATYGNISITVTDKDGKQYGQVIKDIEVKRACICTVSAVIKPEMNGYSAEEARILRSEMVEIWKADRYRESATRINNMSITRNGNEMKFWYTTYGEEPAGGHSLWISLHGGGGTTTEENNGQWENQKMLYTPKEGIYLCPRAPWDAWDMWFQAPIDQLFEDLITTMIVCENVNPNKIYLNGYSAGGDGVWRLAPRLADHWAAAAMMAGHPGDVSLVNVRNLPFTIWVGEDDTAYDRNLRAAERGQELDELQANDPEGYIHDCNIVAGKPHWMDLVDAAAFPWMAQYTRNPYPKKIIWRQEEVTRKAFYWLMAPEEEISRGKQVIAETKDNTIDIQSCDYSSITILLNDDIADLDKDVVVTYGGKTLFSGKLERKESVLRQTLYERNDPGYMFDATLTVNIPE